MQMQSGTVHVFEKNGKMLIFYLLRYLPLLPSKSHFLPVYSPYSPIIHHNPSIIHQPRPYSDFVSPSNTSTPRKGVVLPHWWNSLIEMVQQYCR